MLPEYIRCAVFDADGTLLDSMRMWDELDQEFLARRGILWDETVAHDLHSLYFEESPAYFRRRFGIQDSDEAILEEFRQMANRRYAQDIPAKPGAVRLVHALHDAGIRMCIATASEKGSIQAALDRLGLSECFSFILTCSENGSGKESPEIFHACARRLGGSSDDTAVFEDALYAVRTASQAGFYTVGVQDASVSAEHAAEIRRMAAVYVESLEALL